MKKEKKKESSQSGITGIMVYPFALTANQIEKLYNKKVCGNRENTVSSPFGVE